MPATKKNLAGSYKDWAGPPNPGLRPAVPVIRILEAPELGPEVLVQVLREINDRQWAAVSQVLIEAKFKAEAMLRNDSVFDSLARSTYYQGWVAYADYVIGSLERLRTEQIPVEEQRQPGPEDL